MYSIISLAEPNRRVDLKAGAYHGVCIIGKSFQGGAVYVVDFSTISVDS